MPGQVILSNVALPEPMFSNNADREAQGKRGDIHSSNCEWRGERDGFPAERRTKRPLAGDGLSRLWEKRSLFAGNNRCRVARGAR